MLVKGFNWLEWRRKTSLQISMTLLLARTFTVLLVTKLSWERTVCRQVRCLWRKLINLLLLECQLCGSASLCCTGTAEAEGGGANGSFFKGQVFSPKQHTAQPHWWQLLQHSYSLKKGQDGYMLLTSTSTLLLIRERSSTFQIAAHLHFLSFWHIPGVQHSL